MASHTLPHSAESLAPLESAQDDTALQQADAGAATRRHRRIWALALGTTAALWQLDPAFNEMAEIVTLIACASNKSMAKDAILQMRAKAGELRTHIAPLPASALSKVVRRAEAACGAVLDKGVRMKELQTSWDLFIACVRAPKDPAP